MVCQSRKNYKKRVKSAILAYLSQVKADTSCADCKKHYHYAVMDFDHARGVKRIDLSKTSTWKQVFEELPKCDVVCSNCHRLRTFNRRIFAKIREEGPDLTLQF